MYNIINIIYINIILIIFISQTISFNTIQPIKSLSNQNSLYFKRSESNNDNSGGIWKGITRFLSDLTKAKVNKEYAPLTDSNGRYHLRLIKSPFSVVGDKRHAITRIIRYLPDLKWETAKDIVELSYEKSLEGKSLVRIFQSLKDAKYIAKMLSISDPPILVEIYDAKKDEVLV